MNQANQNAATGGSSGLGDVNPTFFLTPARTGTFLWGFGPDFVLPTATQTSLGAGKWSVGPALALVFRPKPFSIAVIVSNVWSFAGASGKPSVNEGSLQYLLHYGFGRRLVAEQLAHHHRRVEQRGRRRLGGARGRRLGQSLQMARPRDCALGWPPMTTS